MRSLCATILLGQANGFARKEGSDMKLQMKRKNPETVTTFAFLNEHLYQVALRGGYQNELEQVKAYLPTLQRFNSSGELLKAMRRDAKLREKTVGELETLWQENYDLRPASGIILMLVRWVNAPAARADYWYDYFVKLATKAIGAKGGAL